MKFLRMSSFKNNQNLLISDYRKMSIHLCDLNGVLIKTISQEDCFRRLNGICVLSVSSNENNEEIYVYDSEVKAIFVLNSMFKIIKKIVGIDKCADNLSIDGETKIIYLSHHCDDKLSSWDSKSSKLIKEIDIERPEQSRIQENKLYIVSAADISSEPGKRKIKKINKGNYISILSKFDLKIIQKIEFNNWLNPRSLYLSIDSNIYTTARDMDSNGFYSEFKYLFIIDGENYKILKKIQLDSIRSFEDVLYHENKLVLCSVNGTDNDIQIIEF
jgi:hypothetical protein